MEICFHLGIQKLFCNHNNHIHTFGWIDLLKRWLNKKRIYRENNENLINFLLKECEKNEKNILSLEKDFNTQLIILKDFVKLSQDIYKINHIF